MPPTAATVTYDHLRERIATRLACSPVCHEERTPQAIPRTLLEWLLFPGRREDRRISRWTWHVRNAQIKVELTRTTLYYRARRCADGALLGAWCRVVEDERDIANLETFIATYEPGKEDRW
jgi:hypothetical protein